MILWFADFTKYYSYLASITTYEHLDFDNHATGAADPDFNSKRFEITDNSFHPKDIACTNSMNL